MIYGALGDIEEYRGMLKGLDVLIDWLEENRRSSRSAAIRFWATMSMRTSWLPRRVPGLRLTMRRISAITTCRSMSRVARPLRLPRAA